MAVDNEVGVDDLGPDEGLDDEDPGDGLEMEELDENDGGVNDCTDEGQSAPVCQSLILAQLKTVDRSGCDHQYR
jgi:hypothetical protein